MLTLTISHTNRVLAGWLKDASKRKGDGDRPLAVAQSACLRGRLYRSGYSARFAYILGMNITDHSE